MNINIQIKTSDVFTFEGLVYKIQNKTDKICYVINGELHILNDIKELSNIYIDVWSYNKHKNKNVFICHAINKVSDEQNPNYKSDKIYFFKKEHMINFIKMVDGPQLKVNGFMLI